MNSRLLNVLLYIGLSVYFIGALFKIMHWSGGRIVLYPGLALIAAFFIVVVAEMAKSKKAAWPKVVLWCVVYMLAPTIGSIYLSVIVFPLLVFILGRLYLGMLRRQFMYSAKEMMQNQFDSIQ